MGFEKNNYSLPNIFSYICTYPPLGNLINLLENMMNRFIL